MRKSIGFIPLEHNITSWQDLKPYFDQLNQLTVTSVEDLERLILCYSEVLSVYSEQNARAYINMTCHTDNKDFIKRHENFITDITPEVDRQANVINKKIFDSSFFSKLNEDRYTEFKKNLKRELEMFRNENVSLEARLGTLSSKFGQLVGGLTIHLDGKEFTIPQAQVNLESTNRSLRQRTWLAIQETRWNVKKDLDLILSQMIELRDKIAKNTGYKNYRDYKHDQLGRFDYTVQDVLNFHDAIEKHVVPLEKVIATKHRERLGLSENDFRPWDVKGKTEDEKSLKPFKTGEELLVKTKTIFQNLKPEFAKNLSLMETAKLFDLDSRKGKAPGGYNYGLEVTGMPFIFMNAAGTHQDVITLMHESGHAMHSFLVSQEPLIHYRNPSSEIAETASMSMELITSTRWDEFYNDRDLKQARRDHLENIIGVFGWVAMVDSFQHWLYTHPQHSLQERDDAFHLVMNRFGTGLVHWENYEHFRKNTWQKQLHIFEVPFYYIEYAIAQLGAIQVYRNFIKDHDKALNLYIKGLSLGASKSLPEVWRAMGIRFDFSEKNLKELMDFVGEELEKLN